MKVLVGVISPSAAWIMPRTFVEQIRRDFPQHTILEAWDVETIRRLLPDADVAFTPHVDRDIFPSLTRLRWIQAPAAGVGHLLYPEMVASRVLLTRASGIRARPIAEHVLGVTIALARQFPIALRHQARHEWIQDQLEGSGMSAIRTLRGGRMGIIGLGAIGLEVARVAAPFGFRVSAMRRRVDGPLPEGVDEQLASDALPALLAKSDVVVLCAPLTEQTRGLIGAREIAQMKRGALLVNVGRGKLVVDEAVVEGLRSGHLGGAALDVFAREPLDPESPYWDLPNVIVTPHTSGSMEDYYTPLVALFSDNLRRFDRGQPLRNVVDKAAGY
ncbi:MAG TPA: D-2-hydroxyacid dehydrogenase [Vicinamibacterales bacterium]|jgi:phosphoglycerate dehydrogenase-like enzyme|nr:D-2-hydroxyacid dehydrogenase [Vicinamibacterales bacterium]